MSHWTKGEVDFYYCFGTNVMRQCFHLLRLSVAHYPLWLNSLWNFLKWSRQKAWVENGYFIIRVCDVALCHFLLSLFSLLPLQVLLAIWSLFKDFNYFCYLGVLFNCHFYSSNDTFTIFSNNTLLRPLILH